MSFKIALLIDAENISYKELPHILKEARRQGQIILQAVYGDWKRPHLQKWRDIAKKNNFHIRHQTSNPNTKNSSDMKLIFDAIEVLYRRPLVDCFCLVTNDADYIPLCDKIHDEKKRVIGIGYHHAPEALIRSYDQFIFVGDRKAPIQPSAESLVEIPTNLPKQPITPKPIKQSQKTKSTNQPDIRKLIAKAFAKISQDTGKWVALSTLGTALSQVQVGFKTNKYGHTTLSKLLQGMPDFVELQVNGNVVKSARLKTKATSKPPNPNTLQKLLLEAYAKAPHNDRWVTLSELGMALSQVQKGFQTSYYGHSTLKKLLQSMPHFVELRIKGSVNSVRLKK